MPLDLAAILKRIDELAAAPGGIEGLKMVFPRYRSFDAWRLQGDDSQEYAAFPVARDEQNASAVELARRGAQVFGVLFDIALYRAWLGKLKDTRARRKEWAAGNFEVAPFGLFRFTNVEAPEEPVSPAVAQATGCDRALTGWLPFERSGDDAATESPEV